MLGSCPNLSFSLVVLASGSHCGSARRVCSWEAARQRSHQQRGQCSTSDVWERLAEAGCALPPCSPRPGDRLVDRGCSTVADAFYLCVRFEHGSVRGARPQERAGALSAHRRGGSEDKASCGAPIGRPRRGTHRSAPQWAGRCVLGRARPAGEGRRPPDASIPRGRQAVLPEYPMWDGPAGP